MRLLKLTLLVLLCLNLNVCAQSDTSYLSIDKIALAIPHTTCVNTIEMSKYFNTKFSKPEEKVRAIFVWLASNISYDIDNIFAINRYASSREIIAKTLSTRKAICQGYAETFSDLCTKTGIKSIVITGYTKQNGFVDFIPHAWITAFINDQWRLYDPTWGSGYINDNKFNKQLNNSYYDTDPSVMIKDHMPFDPLWQMLNPPLTSAEFYDHKTKGNGESFNFADSIKAYEQLDTIERINAGIRRIEANGIKNSLINDHLNYLHRELDFRKQNIVVAQYNDAVNKNNEAVNLFNKYIDFKNKQFTPKKTDAEIQQMLEAPEKKVLEARQIVSAIQNPDASLSANITSLKSMMNDIQKKIDDEKEFVKKYFNTSKLTRQTLFYQVK